MKTKQKKVRFLTLFFAVLLLLLVLNSCMRMSKNNNLENEVTTIDDEIQAVSETTKSESQELELDQKTRDEIDELIASGNLGLLQRDDLVLELIEKIDFWPYIIDVPFAEMCDAQYAEAIRMEGVYLMAQAEYFKTYAKEEELLNYEQYFQQFTMYDLIGRELIILADQLTVLNYGQALETLDEIKRLLQGGKSA